MKRSSPFAKALVAALPVMGGYVAIGVPCGILESQVGVDPLMSFLVSATFYSGAGQFMVCNLLMAGVPLASVAASVSLVNARQVLYSAAFSPYFSHVRKGLTFLFSATVTDESFGVNLARFANDEGWTAGLATLVNLLCMTSWSLSNLVGCAVGGLLGIPVAISSFAMTSIFICLLVCQPRTRTSVLVAAVAALVVCLCKAVGLAGPAILVGACSGVAAGIAREALS
ncbi:MAG: AzlC family ABC transporter permease [Atopobiaceae bacterium]|nr:AzlC family ABC transporter permease [Atopobiaceae bacterium]